MRLIILVPLVASMNTIEISWLAGSVFVLPVIRRWMGNIFFQIKQFLFFVKFSLGLRSVESLRSKVCAAGNFFVLDFNCWLCCLWNKSRGSNGSTLSELENNCQKEQIIVGIYITSARRSSSSVRMSISRSSDVNFVMLSSTGLMALSYSSISSAGMISCSGITSGIASAAPHFLDADLATPASNSSCACKASSRCRFRSCSSLLRTTTSCRAINFVCLRS